MSNLILFINSFLSYLLVFAVVAVLVVIACILGAKWKKSSDAKNGNGAGGEAVPDKADTA